MATAGADTSDLNLTFGPLLIGLVVDAVLYGVVVLQVYWYWRNELKESRLLLDLLVLMLWLLDTLQLVLASHAVYYFLVSCFGDFTSLEVSVWSLNLEVLPTILVTFSVRLFFTMRLWHLSGKNRWLIGTILVFGCAQLCIGFYMCIISFLKTRFDLLPDYLVSLSMQLAASVAEDILITGSLIYYLEYNRTGIPKTDSLIDTLVRWTISSALLTGIVETAQLVVWVALPKTLLFLPFHLLIGKLYTNSMLAMLNGRKALRQSTQQTTWHSRPGQTSSLLIGPAGSLHSATSSSLPVARSSSPSLRHPNRQPAQELRIDIDTHRRRPFTAPLSPGDPSAERELDDLSPPGIVAPELSYGMNSSHRTEDSRANKDSADELPSVMPA